MGLSKIKDEMEIVMYFVLFLCQMTLYYRVVKLYEIYVYGYFKFFLFFLIFMLTSGR